MWERSHHRILRADGEEYVADSSSVRDEAALVVHLGVVSFRKKAVEFFMLGEQADITGVITTACPDPLDRWREDSTSSISRK